MRRIVNKEHIEGRVYESNLALKTVQNRDSENFGKEFIGGSLDIATDDECLNIVTVHFPYVVALTKQNKPNDTFTALRAIIESGKTVVADGVDAATMVKIDTSLRANDWYSSKDGEEKLITSKRNEGGFAHIVTKLGDPNTRNTFEFDMLINGTRLVEADEEKNIKEDYLIVKGCVFDFRNAMQPVELIVKNQGGIKYFESLDASPSNLVFTKVWGKINNETIVSIREEESAFGESAVKEYKRDIREWVITGTAKETYDTDDEENGITMAEVKDLMSKREVYLAEVKKKNDEYQASKSTPAAGGSNVSAAAGGFNF